MNQQVDFFTKLWLWKNKKKLFKGLWKGKQSFKELQSFEKESWGYQNWKKTLQVKKELTACSFLSIIIKKKKIFQNENSSIFYNFYVFIEFRKALKTIHCSWLSTMKAV